jgi:hypothetical protein
MTFVYLRTLYIRVCGINYPRHTCDEYFVLLAKSGMTLVHLGITTAPNYRIKGVPLTALVGVARRKRKILTYI